MKLKSVTLKKTKNGFGVFANRNFRKNQKIVDFFGKLITYKELPFPYKKDNYIQIGRDLFMGPSGGIDDFFNHSCNPNAGLVIRRKKVFSKAVKEIKKGEEITLDYSTTMNENNWEMDCFCNSKTCRKRIRDFKYLPKKLQRKYIKLGIVPSYNFNGR